MKKETRFIKDGHYVIGDPTIEGSGECYKIGDLYYRDNTGYICYDHNIKRYVIKNSSIIEGIINFKDNKPVIGNFSLNYNISKYPKVYLSNVKSHILYDEDSIKKSNEYVQSKRCGNYFHRSITNVISSMSIVNSNLDKRQLEYCVPKVLPEAIDLYEKFAEFKRQNEFKELGSILGDLTFGCEFETISGNIPERYLTFNGLIPLRDGSINGIEFATIPLSGTKGLESLYNITNLLKKFTIHDETCSLHIHIGNIPRTKEFILSIFKLMTILEDELFEMFPIYKKYNYDVKRKNYTRPFPKHIVNELDQDCTKDINKNFNILFQYLSGGLPFCKFGNDLDKVKSHPQDPNGTSKWNMGARYHHFNMIPLIFTNKQTVEFRIHTPSNNFKSIVSYLSLMSLIIKFAIKNQDKIISGKIRHINLRRLVENSKLPNNLFYQIRSYIDTRKSAIYRETSKRNLNVNEKIVESKIDMNIKNYILDQYRVFNSGDVNDLLEEYQLMINGRSTRRERRNENRLRNPWGNIDNNDTEDDSSDILDLETNLTINGIHVDASNLQVRPIRNMSFQGEALSGGNSPQAHFIPTPPDRDIYERFFRNLNESADE